jgi:hypothetical protein
MSELEKNPAIDLQNTKSKNANINEQKLANFLQKIEPLVRKLSGQLIRFSLFSVLAAIWLALFCYRLNEISLIYSGMVFLVSSIPAIIFFTYYRVLQHIIELVERSYRLSVGTKENSLQLLTDIKNFSSDTEKTRNYFSLLDQAKRIFELIELLKSARSLLGNYASISFIISPVTLFLWLAALLALALITVVFVITVLVALV